MSQSLGQQIRQARKACGMTQEQLAQSVPVSRQTISSWENDRTQPDFETLKMIAQVLGVEIAQLFNDEQERASVPKESQDDAPPLDKSTSDVCDSEPLSDQMDVASEAQSSAGSRRAGWNLKAFCTLALTAVLAVSVVWLLHWDKRPDPQWYMQESLPLDNACYLELSTSELPVVAYSYPPGSEPRWAFRVFLVEKGGVDYTLENITYTFFQRTMFGRLTAGEQHAMTPWLIEQNIGSRKVKAGEVRMVQMNLMSNRHTDGVGFAIETMDEHGNEQTFRIYVPLQAPLDEKSTGL